MGHSLSKADNMILVNMVYQMVSRHMHRHPSGWYSGLSSCGRITVAELLRILTGFPIYFLTAPAVVSMEIHFS